MSFSNIFEELSLNELILRLHKLITEFTETLDTLIDHNKTINYKEINELRTLIKTRIRRGEDIEDNKKLLNSVSVWTGCKELKNSDRIELKYKVNEMDEKDLFFLLGNVFYNDLKASYESNRILTNSVQSNKFNCYSSSVLFGDVLTRLGKENIKIIKTPNHVCLNGKKFIFETTKYNKIFEKTQQQRIYSYAQNLDIKKIIGITYNWCAYIIKTSIGSDNKNLVSEYYNKALEIDSNDIGVLKAKKRWKLWKE